MVADARGAKVIPRNAAAGDGAEDRRGTPSLDAASAAAAANCLGRIRAAENAANESAPWQWPFVRLIFAAANSAENVVISTWCPGAESNHRHCDFQSR